MGKKTGALIKDARTSAGLTQEQLAKKIAGVSASDISKAERGEGELTQDVLKQIAKLTGVTQTSLLNAEKTATKSTASKSTAKTTTKSTKTSKSTAAKKNDDLELSASEKKLIELYRKADSDTKKAAVSLLKGEKSEVQKLLGSLFGDSLSDALGKLLK